MVSWFKVKEDSAVAIISLLFYPHGGPNFEITLDLCVLSSSVIYTVNYSYCRMLSWNFVFDSGNSTTNLSGGVVERLRMFRQGS